MDVVNSRAEDSMKKGFRKSEHQFCIVLFLLILLCGCSISESIDYSDKSLSNTAFQKDIPNAVEMYITAISSLFKTHHRQEYCAKHVKSCLPFFEKSGYQTM